LKNAVTGTPGVGKSTLVEEFVKRRPEYSVIPEMAREMIAARRGKIDSWLDFQLELLWRKTRGATALRLRF